jgi:hypothetical protein
MATGVKVYLVEFGGNSTFFKWNMEPPEGKLIDWILK